MIEIVAVPAHVFALRLSGVITAEDLDGAFTQLQRRLAAQPRLDILIDAAPMTAVDEAVSRGGHPRMAWLLRMHARIGNVALVTPRQWLPALSALATWVLPRSDVHAFEPEEHDLALAWLLESAPRSRAA